MKNYQVKLLTTARAVLLGAAFGGSSGGVVAVEDNVTIYHTLKGKRTEKKRVTMKVASNQWHNLRVDFQGNKFKVTFDGKAALEWQDDTFQEAGRVGLWTKADSVTYFDDLRVTAK